jgi:WD40 repeat protein
MQPKEITQQVQNSDS